MPGVLATGVAALVSVSSPVAAYPKCERHVQPVKASIRDFYPPTTEYLPRGSATLSVVVASSGRVVDATVES